MSVFGELVAVTNLTHADLSASIAVARKSLQSAREYLDIAVGALPDVRGDKTMATPAVVALLLQAVAARRHLSALETFLAPDMAAADDRVLTAPTRLRDPRP